MDTQRLADEVRKVCARWALLHQLGQTESDKELFGMCISFQAMSGVPISIEMLDTLFVQLRDLGLFEDNYDCWQAKKFYTDEEIAKMWADEKVRIARCNEELKGTGLVWRLYGTTAGLPISAMENEEGPRWLDETESR